MLNHRHQTAAYPDRHGCSTGSVPSLSALCGCLVCPRSPQAVPESANSSMSQLCIGTSLCLCWCSTWILCLLRKNHHPTSRMVQRPSGLLENLGFVLRQRHIWDRVVGKKVLFLYLVIGLNRPKDLSNRTGQRLPTCKPKVKCARSLHSLKIKLPKFLVLGSQIFDSWPVQGWNSSETVGSSQHGVTNIHHLTAVETVHLRCLSSHLLPSEAFQRCLYVCYSICFEPSLRIGYLIFEVRKWWDTGPCFLCVGAAFFSVNAAISASYFPRLCNLIISKTNRKNNNQ